MNSKKYKEFQYYGKLVEASEYLKDENNIYPLCNNGIQGETGLLFIQNLLEYDDIVVKLDDEEDDNIDTVFIDIKYNCSREDLLDIMSLIVKTKPDEFYVSSDYKTIRIWWD